jgi:hypothetical protein
MKRPGNMGLEELLRLKRAERPDPAFWARFEAELRVRQLAAIVEKRPWWHPVMQTWGALRWGRLPWGAAGAAAVAIAVFWQHRGVDGVQSQSPELRQTAFVAEAVEDVTQMPLPVVGPSVDAEYPGQADRMDTPAVSAVSPGSLTPLVPWVGEALRAADQGSYRVSEALAVEASLADAGMLGVEVGPALGVNHGFESRALPAFRDVSDEPLAAVPSPREARRQRLMASLASVSDDDGRATGNRSTRAQVRDRLTRRLSEEELYDSVSRLTGGGDRLIVKF